MAHPDHDCDDCGIFHMSFSAQKEHADKNRRTRNVLIVIVIISVILFPASITIFDLIKTPSALSNNIDFDLIDNGYNLACVYEHGMQYCVIRSDETTHLKYNAEKLVLQSKQYPCLNMNLRTPEKEVDMFLVTDGTNCVASLEFPIKDGWSWYEFGGISIDAKPTDVFYVAEKTKQWWDRSNCIDDSFCNWWLEL